MEMNEIDLKRAQAFATQAHASQTRKVPVGDRPVPYIMHPIEVMERVQQRYPGDIALACIAILHDVVEDTDHDLEEIARGWGYRVAQGVDAISRRDGESREDYLERCAQNQDAYRVKLVDIEHNMEDADLIRPGWSGMYEKDRTRLVTAFVAMPEKA